MEGAKRRSYIANLRKGIIFEKKNPNAKWENSCEFLVGFARELKKRRFKV